MFTFDDGSPPHPDVITSRAENLAFRAGLPPVRVHDWRHGWATYALGAGVDVKIVQDRLGHASSKITQDAYQTVLSEVARKAPEDVSAMIPRRHAR